MDSAAGMVWSSPGEVWDSSDSRKGDTSSWALGDIRACRQMGAVYTTEGLSSNQELKLLLNQPSRTRADVHANR